MNIYTRFKTVADQMSSHPNFKNVRLSRKTSRKEGASPYLGALISLKFIYKKDKDEYAGFFNAFEKDSEVLFMMGPKDFWGDRLAEKMIKEFYIPVSKVSVKYVIDKIR